MARAVWSGPFSLVTLPIGLALATDSHAIHLHQIERGPSDRVRNAFTTADLGVQTKSESYQRAADANVPDAPA